MPRQARKQSSSGIYHIMLRGTNRQTLFYNDKDCRTFIKYLKAIKAESPFILYAYCLMKNHVHLLIRESETPLETIMKRIGIKYARYFNSRYKRCGHVFQDRFKSENVEDERYFQTVYRYILRNPAKAGICAEPGDYRWNSYGELFQSSTWIDNDLIFSMMGKKDLISFINAENEDRCMDNDDIKKVKSEEARKLIQNKCAGVEFDDLPDYEQDRLICFLLEHGCSGVLIREELHITDYRFRAARRSGDGSSTDEEPSLNG